MKKVISKEEVAKIAKLSNLTLKDEEISKFADQFTKTIEVVDELNEVETFGLKPTSQVTGLTNVWREDNVDETRVLPQELALSAANRSYKGFFVVERIIE